jgi:ATP-dependent phosphofructokinase / diphosphate-dependent phosphofructokinase
MSTLKGNAVIGQSGGPTSVINQSLVGVILEWEKSKHAGKLYGARHGVKGIVNEDFVNLDGVDHKLLDRVSQTPAAALGSTRDKPDKAYCEKIFSCFKKHDVRYFFYIGGNDSADTARIVSDLAKDAAYELHVYHIPKTIDNDLRVHDHTPGFGSAAKFVAAAIMGDNYDSRSLPGIKIDVIMGRHAGWLTAASVLARQHDEDGPHLIYVPESPLSEEKFLADVDRVYSKQGRCLIAVSEGISTPDGGTWAEKIVQDYAATMAKLDPSLTSGVERDSHGNVQLSGSGVLGDYMSKLVKTGLGTKHKKLRVRADTFGYLQRSFPGFVSETDAKEARLVGQMAVRYSKTEAGGMSVAMRRLEGKKYEIETFLTPLSTVARDTKDLPAEFIADGNNITDAFKAYAAPLVGPLPEVGTFDGLKSVKK